MDTLRALVAGTQITAIEIVFDEKRENLDSFLAERGFLIGQDGDMYRVPIGDLIYGEEMDWFLETASFTGNVVSPVKEDCFEKMKALLAFIDADGGSVIRLIEDLTGEDREDYRIDGPLRGVFVME